MILNIISIILQYSLIALIYYFLFLVIKVIYQDLTRKNHNIHKLKSNEAELSYVNTAQLLVIDHQHINMPLKKFILGENTSIGRGSNNDIVVDDQFVSHEHACISFYKNGHWLSDLNSTNHTYINGTAITDEVLLNGGDVIKIGAVTFKYER